jgi:hypothetical protein
MPENQDFSARLWMTEMGGGGTSFKAFAPYLRNFPAKYVSGAV